MGAGPPLAATLALLLSLLLLLGRARGQDGRLPVLPGSGSVRRWVCDTTYFDVAAPAAAEPRCLTCVGLDGQPSPHCGRRGVCTWHEPWPQPVCRCYSGYLGPGCEVAAVAKYSCGLRDFTCSLGPDWARALAGLGPGGSLSEEMSWQCTAPQQTTAEELALPYLQLQRAYLFDAAHGFLHNTAFCFLVHAVWEWTGAPWARPATASTLPYRPGLWVTAEALRSEPGPLAHLAPVLSLEKVCPFPLTPDLARAGLDSVGLEAAGGGRSPACSAVPTQDTLRLAFNEQAVLCYPLWLNAVLPEGYLHQYRCRPAGAGGGPLDLDCVVQVAPGTTRLSLGSLLAQCA